VKPQAKIYMQTVVPHFDKMVILYGKDKATRNHSITSLELRKRPSYIAKDDFIDIDPTMSQFSGKNAQHFVDDDMDMVPPSPFEHVSPYFHGSSGGNKKSEKYVTLMIEYKA